MNPNQSVRVALVRLNGKDNACGFTRLDLCALLAVVALMALITLPAFATSRSRSDRVLCVNNLRQIGQGFVTWASDHEDQPPFAVPVSAGGTRAHVLAPNVWLHFSWLSNELHSAKILFCPTDTGRPAFEFTGNPENGYLHPNFANRATSYFISHWWGQSPSAIVAGDRNVYVEESVNCTPFRSARSLPIRIPPVEYWSSALHQRQGNLLLSDGRVLQADDDELRRAVQQPEVNGYPGLHLILPR
jgi:hypothetical protein